MRIVVSNLASTTTDTARGIFAVIIIMFFQRTSIIDTSAVQCYNFHKVHMLRGHRGVKAAVIYNNLCLCPEPRPVRGRFRNGLRISDRLEFSFLDMGKETP